jgi:ketosteroid isomerase-like protein
MKKPMVLIATALLGLGVVSCQQKSSDIVHDTFPEEQAKIEKLLEEIYGCAQAKDFDRLASYHLYGPKFTDFKNGERRSDAEGNRKNERESLSAVSDFKYALRDLKVNVYGDAAIATFHGEFSGKKETNAFATKLQGTMVFVKDGAAWKITHEHFSPLK